MGHILVAGGTGLVGTRLVQLLRKKGYEVALLSRKASNSKETTTYRWDTTSGEIDLAAVQNADAVINLAGAGIADSWWTPQRKRLIIESRTHSTGLLLQALQTSPNPVKTYLSASAIGYYGDAGDTWLEETDPAGEGFLAESTQAWEAAFHEAEKLDIRSAALRIGIVLTPKGGALSKMLLPFRARMGSYFGNGRQWYSWIHIDDLCNLFIHALEDPKAQGIYNAVAPNPVTNKELVKAIGGVLGGPYLYAPVPEFVLRGAMGEMADVILSSSRVSAKKVAETGFEFQFPELKPALEDLLKG